MKSLTDTRKFEEERDFKENDICPNCRSAPLRATKAIKSEYQRRYHYLLVCKSCGFKYMKKFAVTGSGRIRKTGFTDVEFIKARDKLLLNRRRQSLRQS
jgi:RNase P subunit RPR2